MGRSGGIACGPSRVGVLTGLRTNSEQRRCSELDRPFVTLPAQFKKHGYHTLSNGKVFHCLHDRLRGFVALRLGPSAEP